MEKNIVLQHLPNSLPSLAMRSGLLSVRSV